jgi:SAM-dependent methyltransferase
MSIRQRRYEVLHRVAMPFWQHFRRKRMAKMAAELDLTAATRVLDVGGSPLIWSFAAVRPDVTVLNLTAGPGVRGGPVVVADATRLPFRDDAFDLTFSNSVIEHVEGADGMRRFAEELTRVGRRYYVQTPNRWFPFEPHLMTPLVHFLPVAMQRRLLRNFTLWGWIVRPSPAEVAAHFRSTHLLTKRQFSTLFPGSPVQIETALMLPKSFVVTGASGLNGSRSS